MSAGYSGTPLLKKLGIKAGQALYIQSAPENYFELLGELPEDLQLRQRLTGKLDFVQLFVTRRKQLEKDFERAKSILEPGGLLWISWPKGGAKAKIPTDLNENIVREIGLDRGMVDIKVCAVDAIWSGLRFAFREKL